MSCLFCNIVNGNIPADIVYQDEHILAFRDINPQAPTHILCIPKKHIATVNDLTAEDERLVGKLLHAAGKLAKQLGFAEDGYRLTMNCNGHGGQTVFHIHLHLLGGRQFGWPPG